VVQQEFGSSIYWLDEHWTSYDELFLEEAANRAQWYGLVEYPYVRVDGSRAYIGIGTCEETAMALRLLIDARLAETGGMSPVEITGSFRADVEALEFQITCRLTDPADLADVRATFIAIESTVLAGGETYPRVARAILYEAVVLQEPGDTQSFEVVIPTEPDWNPANMIGLVFLQKTTGDKAIIQGALFDPNAGSAPAPELASSPSSIESILPNPFRSSAEIRLDVSEAAADFPVRLEVFDASGRRVRTVLDGIVPAGRGSERWNGRADSGEPVPGGIYLVRLRTAEGTSRAKVIRME